MKSLLAKSGILLSVLLIASVVVVGTATMKESRYEEMIDEKCSSMEVQGKLNLKLVTRHLLDFYK
jgi:hypothetical protein